jgi:hypothetical protein
MPVGFFWSSDACRLKRACLLRFLQANKRERTPLMGNKYSDLLFIILMALSVAFMLWVLWNFHKAERKP